jgi:uncharacterized membrane protein
MLLCSQCGAPVPVKGSFCPNCGAAFSQVSADDVNPAALPATAEERQPIGKLLVASGGEISGEALPIPENIAGVVAYITIIPAIVFLFLDPFKRNLFVRFHSFQHLLLWVAGLAFGIASGILAAILQLIPFMRVLIFPLAGLTGLAWFFLWLLLVVKAFHHEIFKLPILGDLAEQWADA